VLAAGNLPGKHRVNKEAAGKNFSLQATSLFVLPDPDDF